MRPNLDEIFKKTYRKLRPGAQVPEFRVEFYPYASVNNTIRLHESKAHVRISDLLEGAPESVIEAVAHILLAKVYRHPIEAVQTSRFRRHVASKDIRAKVHLVRQIRGRKRIQSPRGIFYNLEQIFEETNQRFFHGLLARPQITWSQIRSRRSLAQAEWVR